MKVVLVLTFLVVVTFGCTEPGFQGLDPEVHVHPVVYRFLEDHPNATVENFEVGEKSVHAILDEIQTHCPEFQPQNYVNIEIRDQGDVLLVWYNQWAKEVACAYSPSTCVVMWECGEWGSCVNGKQQRTCTNTNNCARTEETPLLEQACGPTPQCKKLFLEKKFNQNSINVVIIGVNASSMELLENKAKDYAVNMERSLFKIEPFKSNQDKFHFWFVDRIAQVEDKGFNETSDAQREVNSLSLNCDLPNKQIIADVNLNFRSFASWDGPTGLMMVSSRYERGSDLTFIHEFAHTFGFFKDEYSSFDAALQSNFTEERENCSFATTETACPRWCTDPPLPVEELIEIECNYGDQLSCQSGDGFDDGNPCIWFEETFMNTDVTTPLPPGGLYGCQNRAKLCVEIETEEACNNASGHYRSSVCAWIQNEEDPYYKSQCIPTQLKQNIGRGCIEGTACYPGCGFGNVYRSLNKGYMGNGAQGFGYVHESLFCNRIKEVTGSVGGICDNYDFESIAIENSVIKGSVNER